jgi:hypothetical protein
MEICTQERIITFQAGYYEKIQTERQQYKEVKVILTESRKRWRTT